MKPLLCSLLLAALLSAAPSRAAEEPVAVTVRTRNWQGYTFQTSISEDGRYERKLRKEGGPDLSEAPLIEQGTISEANREHLAKIVERSGVFALDADMTKKDVSPDATRDRFDGELRLKRGALEKTVRFGPNIESVPDGVFEVIDEVSRLAQEQR
jgi:hypothetical protein